MSIEDLKNRATIIREETRPLANTAEKVGSVMYETLEAIEDLTTSTSDLAIQEVSIQPVYKDGIIELRCTPNFTSTSKGIFQGKLNQLTVESTLTTPYLDALCIIKITGVSINLSGLTIKKRICQYRDIVDKRIMFELNVPNLLSPFTANNSPIMLINGVKEPIVTIAKTNDQEVELANEGNYDQNYTASQLSGKSVLITALTEGCSIILPLPYNLPVGEYNGKSINFQISETSETLTFRQYTTAIDYVDTECIAGTLINAFYSYSTSLWNVIIITPSEIPAEIVDKSDITVYSATSDVITLFTPTIVDSEVIGATFISDGTIYGGVEPADPQYVFIKNETSNSYNGIYLDTFIDNGDDTYTHYLTKYINVEDLKIVRVQNGTEKGVWQSENLNDESLVSFLLLEEFATKTELSNYSTVEEREAGDLFEKDTDGRQILTVATFTTTPEFIDGAYFTISSNKTNYCIYNGTAPDLGEDYVYMLFSDLVVLTTPTISKVEDPPVFDFDYSIVPSDSIYFLSKEQGVQLNIPYSNNAIISVYNSGAGGVGEGIEPSIRTKLGRKLQIPDIYNLEERLQNIPEYNLTLKKIDLVWIDGFIKIPHTENLNYQRLVKDVSLKADFGSGLVELDAVVNYPSAETYNGTVYQGFYLRDSQNLITELTDFQTIYLSYNIEVLNDGSYRYDGLKENLGINVIESEGSGDPSHVAAEQSVFNAVYPDFAGTYTATPNDVLTGNSIPFPKYRMTYTELKDADLIFVPMVNAATNENVATNPNVLIVAAHYNNDFVRRDITAADDEFLNTVAVNSCASTGTPEAGTCTSYGFGVEFSEDLAILAATYPTFDPAWINPVYQESATCAVVAAKLKKIKIDSGASWSMVRKAARATAYNPRNIGGWDIYMGFGIIDVEGAKTYLADWTSGLGYRKSAADKIQRLNKFVTFEDLDENCPITKKMILELLAAL